MESCTFHYSMKIVSSSFTRTTDDKTEGFTDNVVISCLCFLSAVGRLVLKWKKQFLHLTRHKLLLTLLHVFY